MPETLDSLIDAVNKVKEDRLKSSLDKLSINIGHAVALDICYDELDRSDRNTVKAMVAKQLEGDFRPSVLNFAFGEEHEEYVINKAVDLVYNDIPILQVIYHLEEDWDSTG